MYDCFCISNSCLSSNTKCSCHFDLTSLNCATDPHNVSILLLKLPIWKNIKFNRQKLLYFAGNILEDGSCIQATAVHFSFDFPTWDWWMQAIVALSATFLLMKHLYALYTITAQRLVYHNQQSIKIFSCDPWGPIKRDLVQRCCVNELHPVWPSILFNMCLKRHLFIFYNF